MTTHLLGNPDSDAAKHVWTLWWMRKEFWDGVPGLRTLWVGFPEGTELWPIEPLNGIVAVLLPVPPVLLSNLLAVVHLFLVGLTAGWLGHLVTRTAAGRHAAGALAQCSAYVGFTTALGAGELRAFWLLPLGLALAHEARRTSRREWFVGLGVTMGVTVLACFYYGFFLAIAVSVHALVTLRLRRPLLTGYLLAAGLAVALVVVPVRVFSASYDPSNAHPDVPFAEWLAEETARPVPLFAESAVSLDELLDPKGDTRELESSLRLAQGGGRYLGIGVLILAALGIAAAPRAAAPWAAMSAVGVLLSLGTVLLWDGAVLRLDGTRFLLPLVWLNRLLAWVAEPVNFPARFLALPAVGLAVLGALAMRWRFAAWLVPLAAFDVLTNDLVPFPRETQALPDMAGLRAAAGKGAVANLTPFVRALHSQVDMRTVEVLLRKDGASRTQAIAAQLELEQPFDVVPIERLDYWFPDGLLWLQALPLAKALEEPERAAGGYEEDRWLLHDRGFDRILITTDRTHKLDRKSAALLTRVFGAPTRTPSAIVWTVAPTQVDAGQAALWREAQTIRLAGVERPRMEAPAPLAELPEPPPERRGRPR